MRTHSPDKRPEWLYTCGAVLQPLLEHTSASISERTDLSPSIRNAPLLASFHLHQSIMASTEANNQGWHSVALALLRQCIEALTIVEAGLQSREIATPLLKDWLGGKTSQGRMRANLEAACWPRYGHGLWGESWVEFFGNLAKAVQPYAHYSHVLMGWQYATPDVVPRPCNGDDTIIDARIGFHSYDALKALRIHLYTAILGWGLARMLEENSISCPMHGEKLKAWGRSIATSELLDGSRSSWGDTILPHLFFFDDRWQA